MSETAMKAGRELDALIAEKVMGLSVRPCRSITEPLAIADEHGHFQGFIPHYSTDIEAAKQIESKIKERGLVAEYVQALVNSQDWSKVYFRAPAPDELCLAALKAIDESQRPMER